MSSIVVTVGGRLDAHCWREPSVLVKQHVSGTPAFILYIPIRHSVGGLLSSTAAARFPLGRVIVVSPGVFALTPPRSFSVVDPGNVAWRWLGLILPVASWPIDVRLSGHEGGRLQGLCRNDIVRKSAAGPWTADLLRVCCNRVASISRSNGESFSLFCPKACLSSLLFRSSVGPRGSLSVRLRGGLRIAH